jgi:hypothetical protein
MMLLVWITCAILVGHDARWETHANNGPDTSRGNVGAGMGQERYWQQL